DDFVTQTRTQVRAADTTLLVADPMLSGFLEPEPGDPPVVLLPDLTGDASDPWAWEAPKEDPSSLAVLQFTSGSTADPKGVMLPPPGGWSGCRSTGPPPPPGPTSPTPWPPGPCAASPPARSTCPGGGSPSTAPRPSTPRRWPTSWPPAPRTGSTPERCSPPSGW